MKWFKLLVVTVCLVVGYNLAHAQTTCSTPTTAVTLNCSTKPCIAEACWSSAQSGLSGCNLYITGPGGAMPALSGTVVNPQLCRWTMPLLTTTGNYSLKAAGVNSFGEGEQSVSPLSLTTGAPPAAPFVSAVR